MTERTRLTANTSRYAVFERHSRNLRQQPVAGERFSVLTDTLKALQAKQQKLAAILKSNTRPALSFYPRGSLFDARL